MKRSLRTLSFAAVLPLTLSLAFAQGPTPQNPGAGSPRPQAGPGAPPRSGPRPYAEVVTKEAVSQDGLFKVHQIDDRILFVETSEDVPTPLQVSYWLRNFGAQGILNRVAGLVVGRPRGYNATQIAELDRLIVERLDEWEVADIPVVSGVDIGHTDPQFVLPNNVLARLDPAEGSFRLLEPAVQ